MKTVIQRVTEASVTIDGKVNGKIGKGLMILIGISAEDTKEQADWIAHKIANMRIFEDGEQHMNRSILDIGGDILAVSQFTLYANCKKGNRPSFVRAGKPEHANQLYEYIIEQTRQSVSNVQTGIFGADMKVSLVNDGPFTIMLDSEELF